MFRKQNEKIYHSYKSHSWKSAIAIRKIYKKLLSNYFTNSSIQEKPYSFKKYQYYNDYNENRKSKRKLNKLESQSYKSILCIWIYI